MLSLYEKYRKCCINSTVKECEISEAEMLSHIKLSEINFHQRKENKVPETPQSEIDIYERWKAGRKITSFDQLEAIKAAKIVAAVDMYINQFGDVREVYLSGSYASGSWIDSSCTAEDRKMRAIQKKSKAESDIDLIPVPFHGSVLIDNVEFVCYDKVHKVLIYKNGEYVSSV